MKTQQKTEISLGRNPCFRRIPLPLSALLVPDPRVFFNFLSAVVSSFPLSFQTNSSPRPFICLQSYYVGKDKTTQFYGAIFFSSFFNHFLHRFSPIASWVFFSPQNVPLQHMDKVVKGSTFSCVQRFWSCKFDRCQIVECSRCVVTNLQTKKKYKLPN